MNDELWTGEASADWTNTAGGALKESHKNPPPHSLNHTGFGMQAILPLCLNIVSLTVAVKAELNHVSFAY